MTALVVAETLVLVLMAVLLLGLLRSHAAILRKLHELGVGLEDDDMTASPLASADNAGGATGAQTTPGRPTRQGRPGAPDNIDAAVRSSDAGHDIGGQTPAGATVAIRVVGAEHDTLLVFLSATCTTCANFWDDLRNPDGLAVPPGARIVVVTKGHDQESPSAIAELAPPGVMVVMSSDAWRDYGVPGSPYVVFVDGASGQVRGEGTGGNWEQVANLFQQSMGDLAFAAGARASRDSRRRRKAKSDAEREVELDRALLKAGIKPGDPRLYNQLPSPAAPVEHIELVEPLASTEPGEPGSSNGSASSSSASH